MQYRQKGAKLNGYILLTFPGEVKEDPSVLLWTYFFIAQQYDQLRKTDRALEYIDKVLQHTPTLIEGYMVKAKIYKV